MRYFIRQNIKRGRCSALHQFYKSVTSIEVFNNFSEELGDIGSVFEILDKYFE